MTKQIVEVFVLCAAVLAILGFAGSRHAPAVPAPIVQPILIPSPVPPVEPLDGRRRKIPWPRPREVVDDTLSLFGDRTGPAGISPQVDYPEDLWFKNIGSKKDGKGMCVSTAMEFSLLWAGLEEFRGYRNWAAANFTGGADPGKNQKIFDAYCKAKNIVNPPVLKQYEGNDIGWLKQALRNGWLPGCTLFHSARYKGPDGAPLSIIYHMTNCPHAEGNFAILDNNFPTYEWYESQEQFERAVKNGGKFCAFAFVCPGAPPIPRNGDI